MLDAKIKVKGIKEVMTKLEAADENSESLFDKALGKVADNILADSRDITPFDEGTLRASGGIDDDHLEKTIFYDTAYAARLHEHPEYNFQTEGTGGKYLERPFKEHSKDIDDFVAKDLRTYL